MTAAGRNQPTDLGERDEVRAGEPDEPMARPAEELEARSVMHSLAATFNEHKQELEGQWRQGSGVQTEELRLALLRYRSLFNQLLNA